MPAANMDFAAAAAPPLPSHWTYGEFFQAGGAGRREDDANGVDEDMSNGEEHSDVDGQQPVGTSNGIDDSAADDGQEERAQSPQDSYPPIPVPNVEGLRFPSHDAAAEFICNAGKEGGYKMVRPRSAVRQNGIAIRQRWLCSKGLSRASINKRKADMLKNGIAPVRNKASKKTGCTFGCSLYAIDKNNPTTSEWAISLSRKPVHNHPRDEPKRPKGPTSDPLLIAQEERQARLAGEKDAMPHIIHDTYPLGTSQAETSIWERVRILECKGSEMDYMRLPVCNDWLFHRGNVSFARDRASFTEDYHPIDDGFAMLADGNRTVSVLGIGSVLLDSRANSGNVRWAEHGVLHIPAARCNGLSISRWERDGRAFKAMSNFRVAIYDNQTKAPLFCANDSSGQVRLCMAGESDDQQRMRHLLHGIEIKITADRARLAGLAPDSGFVP